MKNEMGLRATAAGLWLACTLAGTGLAQAAQLMILSPAQGSQAAATIVISGSAQGYLNVEISFNGTLLGRTTPAATGDFSVSVNTSGLPDGADTLVVNAWNSPAGQPFTLTQQVPLPLLVANSASAPLPSPVATSAQLTLTSPAQNSAAAGSVQILGLAPGYLNVEISYAGSLLGRVTPSTTGAFSVPVSTLRLPNGPCGLIINAWNSPAGQPFTLTQQTKLNLLVNNAQTVAPPAANQLVIGLPAQSSVVSGQTTLSGSAAGFQNVEVYFNGILLGRAAPSAAGAFSITFSTTSLPEGPQTLAVDAWNAPAGQPYTATAAANWSLQIANGSLNIEDFGAVPDGVTDNAAFIANAIAAAQSRGVSVFVPAGHFAYGSVIRLTGTKIFGVGAASVLYALNWAQESIFMYGSGSEVRQLKLAGVTAPSRQAAWEATRVTLFGATNFVIDHVTIAGSAAAGIQTAQTSTGRGASNGYITNNTVSNTLADSIHLTAEASYITVQGNSITNAGDDGIAVVSYLYDGGYTSNITALNNQVIGNAGGRAMSVVGGENILYQNNFLEGDAAAACLYFAQEGNYGTYGVENATAENNTLQYCGNPAIGHGAIMVVTTGSGQNTGIQLLRNDIIQKGDAGIRVFGANQSVVLDDNLITGASPPYDIQDAGVALTLYASGSVGYVPAPALPIP